MTVRQPLEKSYTMDEAAAELRICRRMLQDLIARHPHYHANGRRKLFTEPFSLPGDSGSLITHTDEQGAMHAVGLLFAGDGLVTWAVPVNEVLEYFDVELVGGHNV